jgi:hypothetical protein
MMIFFKSLTEVIRVLKKNGVLVGTVPYRENLADGVAICPDCGRKFHRWGHMQSLDKYKMRIDFHRNNFYLFCLSVKSFVYFSCLSELGKLKLLLRWSLGKMGLAVASPSLFFSIKRNNRIKLFFNLNAD